MLSHSLPKGSVSSILTPSAKDIYTTKDVGETVNLVLKGWLGALPRISTKGGLAEMDIAPVLKTEITVRLWGFESSALRQITY